MLKSIIIRDNQALSVHPARTDPTVAINTVYFITVTTEFFTRSLS